MSSRLRKHLQAARQEYEALSYPGDLAGQVLRSHSRGGSGFIWRIAAVGVAVAAVLAIAVLLRQTPMRESPTGQAPIAVNNAAPAPEIPVASQDEQGDDAVASNDDTATEDGTIEVSLADLPVVSAPEAPDDMNLAPSTPDFSFSSTPPDFSFSAPSFSFQSQQPDESSSEGSSTSAREAV